MANLCRFQYITNKCIHDAKLDWMWNANMCDFSIFPVI